MNKFDTILVPLDGSEVAARALGCAAWLAERLHARLHVVGITREALPATAALARLRVPERHRRLVTLHLGTGVAPEEAIAATAERLDADLLILSARGEAAELTGQPEVDERRLVGHVTRDVIETTARPVVVLPPGYTERLPWRSMLVPMSGETRTDAALALALQLARALDMHVLIAHVLDSEPDQAHLGRMTRYQDAAHHELRERFDEMIARACPMCDAAERATIWDVLLCRGDAAEEFVRLTRERDVSLVVIGWHGWFMDGHARVLKNVMRGVSVPVLLWRTRAREPFRLRVGDEL